MTKQESRVRLTAGRVETFVCQPAKSQSFLWDTDTPTLALRATPTGRKTFVFESRLRGSTIRVSIGTAADWPIQKARGEAQCLKMMVDAGIDPREVERQQVADKAAQISAAAAQAVTVGDVWPRYVVEGRPKRKDAFKPRYLDDIKAMAAAGGEDKKRGEGKTRPGPIYPLLSLRLVDVNEDALINWFDHEALTGKPQAARALMIFRGFLRWCSARPEYRVLVDREAGKASSLMERLPQNKLRTDALEAAQVAGWWRGTEQLENRTAGTYLQALLLTGARKEELAALTWANVHFDDHRMVIADKVDDTRVVPLGPYLERLLAKLPRVGPFVFASTSSKSGRITDARASNAKAAQNAGKKLLTMHGLRRSFSLLGEAAGAPAGAIAQVMGHKPSATAEGYRPRSIDALRPFVVQIEAYILGLAGVDLSVLLPVTQQLYLVDGAIRANPGYVGPKSA